MNRLKDRTQDFRAYVSTAGTSADASRALVPAASGTRSEFTQRATAIGRGIEAATFKLEKLAQLAKRKSLFDDRPVEISELTYIIRQDMAQLNQQIAELEAVSRRMHASKPQTEHNNNVLMLLQSKLATTTSGFQDVLEIRTQNMKASRDRTEQFSYTGAGAPGAHSDSPLYLSKGKDKKPASNNDYLALDLGTMEEGQGQSSMQQLELMEQQDTYISQRTNAIETIESTVAELGQVFSQLATMVAAQGEQVSRIGDDTEDIATNVQGAQDQLLKYLASVSSNRALMLKVFGIIVLFFLVFVMVS